MFANCGTDDFLECSVDTCLGNWFLEYVTWDLYALLLAFKSSESLFLWSLQLGINPITHYSSVMLFTCQCCLCIRYYFSPLLFPAVCLWFVVNCNHN